MKTRMQTWAGVAVAGLVVATLGVGCSGQDDPRELFASGRPIIYGTVDTVPSHVAVVAVTDSSGAYFCSGTLISEYVVLTAGHCLDGETAGGVRIFFGSDVDPPGIVGEYRYVSEILVHPQFSMATLMNDIALARLSSAPPAGIAPIRPCPWPRGSPARTTTSPRWTSPASA